jgi:hypothetical protein
MLAWIVFGFVLLGLGVRAHDGAAFTGQVAATAQEADEGYFSVGQEQAIVVKPGTQLQQWLKSHTGQRVKITIEPDVDSH